MSRRVKEVVILGGGSAGWLTAGILAAEFARDDERAPRITLVESPDVKTVGVGEGTWPSMRDTLRRLGVSETEFFRSCDAAFKQASRFSGWCTGTGDDHYYHPFSIPAGFGDINVVPAWRRLEGAPPFAGVVSFQPRLCDAGRAPKQARTPEFAAVANYAYHLDAGKFGDFLRDHCVHHLGVRHLRAHVREIRADADGDIAALVTEEAGELGGDLFVDCSGFASVLLGEHYGIPRVSTREWLFCDTALAVQVPWEGEDTPIPPYTQASARDNGWIWDIGLPTRRGVGHVYSRDHGSDEAAETALRRYVADSSGLSPDEVPTPRKLDLAPGYRREFWHRNCVAVGISAGFIEPLEASALALIELSAKMIAEDLPADRAAMDTVARRFNERFTYRWSRIIDFLKLHYVLSRREDSDFWRDNRSPDSVPETLRELLALWRHRPPNRNDFQDREEIFPAASYQYVLYGMGFEAATDRPRRRSDDPDAAVRLFQQTARQTRQYLSGLPSHRELLHLIRERGLPAGQPTPLA